jgi:alkanesulfonate monooxygenase SsuD/methylene tetrahydromethanopterin reductase-like flavin-dependent oxidoreductase (luciferase family)
VGKEVDLEMDEKQGKPVKFGLDVQTSNEHADPKLLAELAVEAEAAGWDGFFIWDVIYDSDGPSIPVADAWVTLALIAAATTRIRLGAMVTPLARKLPWEVARAAAVVDRLSNGRIIFGAGLGYQAEEFEPFGQDFDPKARAERLDEALEILKGLWKGGAFCFNGQHFQINVQDFQPRPFQEHLPVWCAGYWSNKRPFRRAARYDGVYIGQMRADGESVRLTDVKEAVTYVRSHRTSSEPFEIAFCPAFGPEPGQAYWEDFVKPYIDAGVTWWIEAVNQWVGTLPALRERIRSGPPVP